MSTPRRKSYNNVKQAHKKKSQSKRYSHNNISSPSHKYSHHHPPLHHQIHPHLSQLQLDNSDNNNNNPDDISQSRPTHKKNAVSSFLSIFSSFAQNKAKNKHNSNGYSIDTATDLELLKKLKRKIVDIMAKYCDNKKLRKLKSDLNKQVWDIEYSELKKRLSTHDIQTATQRQKLFNVKSLRQLSSLHVNNDINPSLRIDNALFDNIDHDKEEIDDMREMATFLLENYYDDQPVTTTHAATAHIVPLKLNAKIHLQRAQTDTDLFDDDDDDDIAIDDDDDDIDSLNSSDNYEDDEKQIQINQNQTQTSKKTLKRKKSRRRQSKTYRKRISDKQHVIQRQMDGNLSDGGLIYDKQSSIHRRRKSHKYANRTPVTLKPVMKNQSSSPFPDIDNISSDKRMSSRDHRVNIIKKFQRGVRKAMMFNAVCSITKSMNDNKKRLSLSLSTSINNDIIKPYAAPQVVVRIPSHPLLQSINSDGSNNTPSAATFKGHLVTYSQSAGPQPLPGSGFGSFFFLSDNLNKALSSVGTWEFDPFEFMSCPEVEGKCLVFVVWYLCDKLNLFKLFPSISPAKFMKFISSIENAYLDNPYHNKMHAADIVSNVSYYLTSTEFCLKHTSLFDRFTAILSAAVHDVGHDGNNNAYHITTMSDLAIRYNDISVLENYHIAYTFQILKRNDCNWYKSLKKPIQKYLRSAMIDMVLATDMKYHTKKLAQLTGLCAVLKRQLNQMNQTSLAIALDTSADNLINTTSRSSIKSVSSTNSCLPYTPFTPTSNDNNINIDNPYINLIKPKNISDFALYKYVVNEIGVEHLLKTEIEDRTGTGTTKRVLDVNDERRFILSWIVHLCDISSCAKSIKSGKKWAGRVMTEFFKQGDRERALGLNVSAMMDRRRSTVAGSQIGFIKFILRPSYTMFTRLVPEANQPLQILNDNLEYWENEQKRATQERKTRAKSVGSIKQADHLKSYQQELILLNTNRDDTDDDNDQSIAIGNDDNDDDDDNDNDYMSLDIDIIDHNDDIDYSLPKTKTNINKHVGFSNKLIVGVHTVDNPHDNDIIDNESVQSYPPPVILSSKSDGNHSIHQSSTSTGTQGTFSTFHANTISSITATTTHSSISTSNTIDNHHHHHHHTNNGLYNSSNNMHNHLSSTRMKTRAHSIHVSIPTSSKQISQQPQPFANTKFAADAKFLAELRKEFAEQKEEEEKKNNIIIKKKSTKINNRFNIKSDGLLLAKNKKIIKNKFNSPSVTVEQSVSVGFTRGSPSAQLSNDKVKNKQKHDVV